MKSRLLLVLCLVVQAVVAQAGSRVIVVGYDGLSWPLLQELNAQQLLPNFRRLAEGGVSGPLASVIPPSSPPAWVTAVTGVNPGKHGIYGFIAPIRDWPDSNHPAFSLNNHRASPAIWEILSQRERKSGLINIPITYPPDAVDGFMVSGFPLDPKGKWVYPPNLIDRIRGYRVDLFADICRPGHEDEWLADLADIREKRFATAQDLIQEEPWDLFWVVFTFTDRAQHFFWKYKDSRSSELNPEKVARYHSVVDDVYIKADQMLGQFMAIAKRLHVPLVVLSDHGFGPVNKVVRANRAVLDSELIDRASGKAKVYYSDFFGGKFFINLKGREPDGCVAPQDYERVRQHLIDKLQSLKDPETGQAIVQSLWKREELYSGDHLGDAPDVVCLETPGYLFARLGRDKTKDIVAAPLPEFFSGFHEMQGIFFAQGPGIIRGKSINDAKILDITPTLLQMLGESTLSTMDGKIMREIFEASVVPVGVVDGAAAVIPHHAATDKIDRDELEKQLKNVGYVR